MYLPKTIAAVELIKNSKVVMEGNMLEIVVQKRFNLPSTNHYLKHGIIVLDLNIWGGCMSF